MSALRFEELRSAAPQISADEAEKLGNLPSPRRSLIAVFVRLSLMLLWSEATARKQKAEALRKAALKRSMQPIPGSETAAREARGEYEHREYVQTREDSQADWDATLNPAV